MLGFPTDNANLDPAIRTITENGSRLGFSAADSPGGDIVVPNLCDDAGSKGVGDVLPAAPPWKRLLDVTCILAALPVVLPVAVLVALLIKCVSAGPIFYRQERVGYRGRRFVCLKFRTMHVGTSTSNHEDYCRQLIASEAPMAKLDDADDHRIIPLGPVLRAMGLDELPQLLNVLRGEMSLVGPRPCLPAEYDAYEPRQKGRFNALPGLTGLWQVSGKNSTTFSRMIELDLDYIQRRSLLLDLRIMALTIPVVLRAAASAVRRWLARIRLFFLNPWRGRRSPAS